MYTTNLYLGLKASLISLISILFNGCKIIEREKGRK
jgi:hypothetical protein